jgi:PAP2 superfamily
VTQERLDFVPATTTPERSGRGRIATWRSKLRAHRRAWMAIRGFREVLLVVAVYSLYDITRYLVAGDHEGAMSHGRQILRFERRIGVAPEHWLNHLVSPHALLAVPADYIYATLHYLVTPAVLVWMWRRHSEHYIRTRTVLLATTLVGLACFTLWPAAPPRMLPGFIDTMARYSHYGWWGGAASAPRGFGHDTNQYAALPSLHVAWALWAGWLLFRFGQHRITRILGVLYPIVLAAVVIATANHYFVDVVAGVVVLLIGAAIGWVFTQVDWPWRRAPDATSPPPGAA